MGGVSQGSVVKTDMASDLFPIQVFDYNGLQEVN